MAAIGTKRFDFDLTEAKVQIVAECEDRLERWKSHSAEVEALLRVDAAIVGRLRPSGTGRGWTLSARDLESVSDSALRKSIKERLRGEKG